jgi:hypothetical protein
MTNSKPHFVSHGEHRNKKIAVLSNVTPSILKDILVGTDVSKSPTTSIFRVEH